MLLGAVADDFTGASDLANTLAKGGMATTLFAGPNGAAGACEAGVVALKTRSIPADEAVAQSRRGGTMAAHAGLRTDPFQILLDIRFDAFGQYRAGHGGASRSSRFGAGDRLPGVSGNRPPHLHGAPLRR